jgi:hypothetical protein
MVKGNARYIIKGTIATVLGHGLKNPLFIIGTGRCGTTLLVQVLKSHERLLGFPGEANELWHPKSYPFATRSIETPAIVEDPQRFTDISLANWPVFQAWKIRKTFAGYRSANGPSKTLFVKSAMISFMIPKILSLFPDARFMHIFRNGPSVVASFLKKEWSKYSGCFENEPRYLLHCAGYWNDCILEIEKRKAQLSLVAKGAFLEFSYEKLCEDPKAVLGRIGEFLRVPSEEFHFDISQISSRNYKVGDVKKDETWAPLLEIMSPGMKLKGYVT